jgi:hydroxymethylpyrimidine pyrophosphatase-like HAD family hydrolase
MKYKMLVLDLDDTLLTDDHTSSRMLFWQGIRSLCYSGFRKTNASNDCLRQRITIDNSYMISYNGAVITDLKEDKVILSKR